jgi:hypothetical protein
VPGAKVEKKQSLYPFTSSVMARFMVDDRQAPDLLLAPYG